MFIIENEKQYQYMLRGTRKLDEAIEKIAEERHAPKAVAIRQLIFEEYERIKKAKKDD